MKLHNTRRILLNISKHLSPQFKDFYIRYDVDVPDNASKLGLIFNYHNPVSSVNPEHFVAFIAFHDPDGFRGQRMNPGGKGDVCLELWTAPDSASEGAIPGNIQAGLWWIQIDIRALTCETDFQLQVYSEESECSIPELEVNYPSDYVVKSESGWYKGELHAHSTESDGKFSVEQVIQAAIDYDLDFYSLTDHTTTSQWHKLANLQNSKTAIIRSMEITSHLGHANLHGISQWVNVYIDQPGWSSNQAAQDVHRQGGLFCVNHAFSGVLAWRDFDLDWGLVDMEEIFHNLEGANNAYQLALWDQHLNHGYRIVGVGGTDSHNPFEGIHELGQVVTWVYADELSEKGIIEGLRRGQVYVSRGPELRFSAKNDQGVEAKMWESLDINGSITLEIEVKWDAPLNLFIIKNGFIMDVLNTNPGSENWQKITYQDPNSIDGSYYRVELHDCGVKLPYVGIIWRDFSTLRVLSNPIWIGRDLLRLSR